MKHLFSLLLAFAIFASCSAQDTWKPNPNAPKHTDTKNGVQCWGTTGKQARCKLTIDPEAPGKAVKGKDGHWYCHFHVKQAN